jgi:Ca2+-binding RTX toxin-like protein
VIENQGGSTGTGIPGGVTWTGDDDAEYIFGTMWGDTLSGGVGNDLLYGFEGDDTITGGYGVDRMFGDAGNDYIVVGEAVAKADLNPLFGGVGTYGEFVGST